MTRYIVIYPIQRYCLGKVKTVSNMGLVGSVSHFLSASTFYFSTLWPLPTPRSLVILIVMLPPAFWSFKASSLWLPTQRMKTCVVRTTLVPPPSLERRPCNKEKPMLSSLTELSPLKRFTTSLTRLSNTLQRQERKLRTQN